jgi:hypothetical protein
MIELAIRTSIADARMGCQRDRSTFMGSPFFEW